MTRKEGYWDRVKARANKLGSDVCSGVPNLWYSKCCEEHDIHYRTHRTLRGKPITKKEADKKFYECMRKCAPGGCFSPTAMIYYIGVVLFGYSAWAAGARDSSVGEPTNAENNLISPSAKQEVNNENP